jgi:hypothetical protein
MTRDAHGERQLDLFEMGTVGEPGRIYPIRELLTRSRLIRPPERFLELLRFFARFPEHSPFNVLLVFIQNPHATRIASARRWERVHHRKVREEARPLLILAPSSPVSLLYDVADTEGTAPVELPHEPLAIEGVLEPTRLRHTEENAELYGIGVTRRPAAVLQAPALTVREEEDPRAFSLFAAPRILVQLNDRLDPLAAYATLVHELAHVLLGHLGSDPEGWWPERPGGSEGWREAEACTVEYLVSRRAGLPCHPEESLLRTLTEVWGEREQDVLLLVRVTGLLEQMGHRKLEPPHPRHKEPA